MRMSFEKYLGFVSKSKIIEYKDEGVVVEEHGAWAIYKVYYNKVTTLEPVRVLYFMSSASVDSLRRGVDALGDSGYCIYPPSFSHSSKIFDCLPFVHSIQVLSTQAFLLFFVRAGLEANREALIKKFAMTDYIDVKIEQVSSVSVKGNDAKARLRVIVASPGQGKTYYTRKLALDLAEGRRSLTPLYIASQNWGGLVEESRRDVWSVAYACLKSQGLPIHWVEGNEKAFLSVLLDSGLSQFFFDGFDEFVLSSKGVSALGVIDSLCEMVNVTGAEITITSREEYWDLVYDGSGVQSKCDIVVERLCPFNTVSAREYFSKKIAAQGDVEVAVQYYRKILESLGGGGRGDRLAGKGITLRLIAELCNGDISDDLLPKGVVDRYPLLWIITGLCRREVNRQRLDGFDAERQIELLDEIALRSASGVGVSGDDVVGILERLKVPSELIHSLAVGGAGGVAKLRMHPLLLCVDGDGSNWFIRDDQVKYNLLARQFIRICGCGGDQGLLMMQSFVHKMLSGNGVVVSNIAECILDQVFWNVDVDAFRKVAVTTVRRLIPVGGNVGVRVRGDSCSRLAVAIAFSSLARLSREGGYADKTFCLLELLGDQGVLRGLSFTGDISRFEFLSVAFVDCTFSDVHFLGCKFGKDAVFSSCIFDRIRLTDSDDIARASFVDCIYDDEAQYAFNIARLNKGMREYSFEDVDVDMKIFLNCFIGNLGVRLDKVPVSSIASTQLGKSKFFDIILGCLEKYLCNSIECGFSRTLVLKDEVRSDIDGYFDNAVYSGALRVARLKLRERLCG